MDSEAEDGWRMIYNNHWWSSPTRCVYLPDEVQRMEYVQVGTMSREEYQILLDGGWRRFGNMLFRPVCSLCSECRSLRIEAAKFVPNRSQRRVRKLNEGLIDLQVGQPRLSREKLELYGQFHEDRVEKRHWPYHRRNDGQSFLESFVINPIPTLEFCYRYEGRLVGLGYVDDLPDGFSAIYFVHDPNLSKHSLGVWNILCLIEEAARQGRSFVYLGYYVADCASLAYKIGFKPNQILLGDGEWHDSALVDDV